MTHTLRILYPFYDLPNRDGKPECSCEETDKSKTRDSVTT